MLEFYLYFGIICILVFTFGCLVAYVVEREKRDTAFAEKMDRIREKLSRFDPFTKFATNLFWWIFGFLVIYYIYLG